jgi:hypothetical protein
VSRAAHEVNNALNGAAMNLEVVRLRAAPGKDAGAVAAFADAAVSEQEAVAQMTGALIALGRAPKAGAPTDVRAALAHAAALLGPSVRHDGQTLAVVADDPAPTRTPAYAVRLAAVWALERGAAAAGGSAPAGDRSGVIRCKLSAGPEATLDVSPGPAAWEGDDAGTVAVLAAHGIRATADGVALRLTFPAP